MSPPAVAALLAAAASLPAAAQAPSVLEGRLVLAPDSTTLAGRTVVLHRVTRDTGMAVDSAATGPDGGFSFPLHGDAGDVFVVSARHDGILYFGPAVEGGSPADAYRLTVHPLRAARPSDTLSLASRALVLTPSPSSGGVQVTDVVQVRGSPTHTLAGRVPVGEAGRRETWWRIGLPEGARDPRVLPGGLDAREVELAGAEARLSAPVPPTGVRVVLGYGVPRGGEIRLRTLHPADHLEVVVREDVTGIGVDGLPGPEAVSSAQTRYRRYSARGSAPGRSVRVTVAGGDGAGIPRSAWIAGAAGLLLAAAAAVAGWAGRRGGEA